MLLTSLPCCMCVISLISRPSGVRTPKRRGFMETKEGSNPQARSKVWRYTTPALKRMHRHLVDAEVCRHRYKILTIFALQVPLKRAQTYICERASDCMAAPQHLIQRCSEHACSSSHAPDSIASMPYSVYDHLAIIRDENRIAYEHVHPYMYCMHHHES